MSFAQIEKGNFLADLYCMGPTQNGFSQSIWPNALNQDNYKGIGAPVGFGLRAEYMLADKLSIHLEGNYAFGGFQYNGTYVEPTSAQTTTQALFQAKYTKTRIMLGSNFYFLRREVFQMYTGLALGYYHRTEAYTVDGQTAAKFEDLFLLDEEDIAFFPNSLQIPLAGRVRIGSKFFFSENLGAMIEVGLIGGSIIEFGLATKF